MTKNKQELRLTDYLNHTAQAIERIFSYTHDVNKSEWKSTPLIQDAVLRNIEVIGEASKNVQKYHPAFAKKHSAFPWDDAYWMRNVVAHGYFQVDLDIVWQTILIDLPKFMEMIRFLQSENSTNEES
jgi:uncharacterized protein with HEPN domain